jgi:hypothetical protein
MTELIENFFPNSPSSRNKFKFVTLTKLETTLKSKIETNNNTFLSPKNKKDNKYKFPPINQYNSHIMISKRLNNNKFKESNNKR